MQSRIDVLISRLRNLCEGSVSELSKEEISVVIKEGIDTDEVETRLRRAAVKYAEENNMSGQELYDELLLALPFEAPEGISGKDKHNLLGRMIGGGLAGNLLGVAIGTALISAGIPWPAAASLTPIGGGIGSYIAMRPVFKKEKTSLTHISKILADAIDDIDLGDKTGKPDVETVAEAFAKSLVKTIKRAGKKSINKLAEAIYDTLHK